MENTQKLACYFPTTVLFVDDKKNYLENLGLKLDYSKFVPEFFYDPNKALNFLKGYAPVLFNQRCLYRNDSQLDHRNIEVKLPLIRQEIYNAERFSQISVIVVDYAMPNINGLELCQQLKDKPFKKIMLTGEADEAIAIQAFNEKLIDKFIQKDAPDFYQLLNRSVNELQWQYFADLSHIIIDSITADLNFPHISWLNDPDFYRLFQQVCLENQVVEYYLTDVYGSFLMLNAQANPVWLAVKDEDAMNGAYMIADGALEAFPKKILKEMRDKEKMLYLYEEGGLSEDPIKVEKSLHEAKKLKGNALYYYALIKDANAYDIQANKIVSYNAYFKNKNGRF